MVKEPNVKKKAFNHNQEVRVLFQQTETPAKNVSYPLHQLSLEVKVVGEEIEVERDDGSEYKDNQESRGEDLGTADGRFTIVSGSDPGMVLGLFHSHPETRVGHKQTANKVLCLVAHLLKSSQFLENSIK